MKKLIASVFVILLFIACTIYSVAMASFPKEMNQTGYCSGIRVYKDEYNIYYDCPLDHENCFVRPIMFYTVGNPNETDHFHSAYHTSNQTYYPYCTYGDPIMNSHEIN